MVVVLVVVVWYIVRFLNWTTKFARAKHMSIYIVAVVVVGHSGSFVVRLG